MTALQSILLCACLDWTLCHCALCMLEQKQVEVMCRCWISVNQSITKVYILCRGTSTVSKACNRKDDILHIRFDKMVALESKLLRKFYRKVKLFFSPNHFKLTLNFNEY